MFSIGMFGASTIRQEERWLEIWCKKQGQQLSLFRRQSCSLSLHSLWLKLWGPSSCTTMCSCQLMVQGGYSSSNRWWSLQDLASWGGSAYCHSKSGCYLRRRGMESHNSVWATGRSGQNQFPRGVKMDQSGCVRKMVAHWWFSIWFFTQQIKATTILIEDSWVCSEIWCMTFV